jgi:hypothetical protein
MGFIAWIRKGKDALHECAESIRQAEERKRNQKLPSNHSTEVRAVVSFSDETVRDAKTQASCEHATQESIKNATWTAVVAASIYALISLLIWCQMVKQSRIASDTLRQSIESFRIDERAWIELEPIKTTPHSPRTEKIGASFEYPIYIRNGGKTVACDVQFRATRNGSQSSISMSRDAHALQWEQDQLLLGKVPSAVDIPIENPIPKVLAPNTTSPVAIVLHGQEPQIFPKDEIVSYLIGRIDYCDEFKVKHWLKFCFFVVNARGEIWACQEGNDEDKNFESPTPDTSCEKPN